LVLLLKPNSTSDTRSSSNLWLPCQHNDFTTFLTGHFVHCCCFTTNHSVPLLAIRIPINEPLTPTTIQLEFLLSTFSPQLNYIYIALLVYFLATRHHDSSRLLPLSTLQLSEHSSLCHQLCSREDKSISRLYCLTSSIQGPKTSRLYNNYWYHSRFAPFLILTPHFQPLPSSTSSSNQSKPLWNA
jgi:hypothetical protein